MEETITISGDSSLELEEAQMLMGNTVASIEAREFTLEITFTDGVVLSVTGAWWHGAPLSVVVEAPKHT
jgi:hypothetical protein